MQLDIYQSEVKEIWQSAMLQNLFPGRLVVEIGCSFLGAPYRSGTLEKPGRETLVINLAEFDCTTFVETVLALARCGTAGNLEPAEFRKNLKLIRYRQGKIDGYASRLHYFSDWIKDNEKKKVLVDVSRLLKGNASRKKINFMTTNRNLYPALKQKATLEKMQNVEKNLSRKNFHTIPRDDVSRQKAQIQQGDIIAFTTHQEGLDVAHTGFAIWQGRQWHLLHASSKEKAVVISKESVFSYLKANKALTGIMIARLL